MRDHSRRRHLLGAQRLSASKRRTHARAARGLHGAAPCSTPFGIKEKDTRIGDFLTVHNGQCSTPFGIKEKDTRVKTCAIALAVSCSTPFGIKEKDTRACQSRSRLRRVLNAFRHQREGHKYIGADGCCSFACAQRLSASKRRTLGSASPPARLGHVLNAFRHQREGHSAPPTTVTLGVNGAQRLSASKRRTP